MEQKPRARYDEFAEQFISVLHEHWSDILQDGSCGCHARCTKNVRAAVASRFIVEAIYRVRAARSQAPEELPILATTLDIDASGLDYWRKNAKISIDYS